MITIKNISTVIHKPGQTSLHTMITEHLHTVPYTLITQDNKVQLTKAFTSICQLPQLRRPSDAAGDIVWDCDDEDRPPPPPSPATLACLPSLFSWCCPILVVNCTFLHLWGGFGWGLWAEIGNVDNRYWWAVLMTKKTFMSWICTSATPSAASFQER